MSRTTDPATADREIVITRDLDAPRALVFDAWTDVKHLAKWWGPNGFSTTTHAIDVRPGGTWRFVMHGPDGRDYQNKITYLEIAKPSRIVYAHGGEEEELEAVTFRTTVTFDELGGKTRVTMRMVFPTAEERDRVAKEYGAVEGGKQTLARLAEFVAQAGGAKRPGMTVTLPSDREIRITREFAAPRRLVFDAWTRPEHVRRWWGLASSTMTVCEIDLRPGGAWRYVLREADGQECGFRGVYREVSPPNRLVHTQIFEPLPQFEALVTVTFTEENGRTTMTETILHQSTEARDGHLQSGLEGGMTETLARLDELLATL